MVNHLFSVHAYFMPPYQLGHDNEEGLESGAWRFYYKLKFRPEDAGVRRLLRQELARMKRNRRHRSSISTLQKLTAENLYFYLNDRREDIILPGVEKWSKKERRDLARVVRAKGRRRESDFVRLFDGHKKLRRALVKLMSAT
jgi:hypothetical protein